jgi:multidrug efflux system membrane fusion protein
MDLESDMTSQDTDKDGISTAGGARQVYDNRIKPALASAGEHVRAGVGKAEAWSKTHLPGGAPTMWIVGGLVLLGLLVWVALPGENANQRRGFGAGGPMSVGVVRAETGSVPIAKTALGTVTPLATVTVRPQVGGQIIRFFFQEGEMVSAGQPLAQIDPRPFEAARDQAVGQLERDKAALANSELDLKRYRALAAQNAISAQQVATQAALVRQNQGTVKSDTANVKTASINLGYARVVSPVNGRVGIRKVDIGNFIAAGDANGIVVVTQENPISVLFALPEDSITDITSRMRDGATLQVEALDRAQSKVIATGKLATVDNQVDTTTGTVKMRAMFDNQDGALFPNQFVNVRLLVDTMRDVIVLPASAIQRGASGNFVYVVGKDSTVSMRNVNVGPSSGDRVAILKSAKPGDGLKVGETVVSDGADRLRDGAQVVVPAAVKGSGLAGSATPPPQNAAKGERGAGGWQGGAGGGGRFKRMLEKLPPEERAKVEKMSREERRAYFRKLREQRSGGGGGTP